MAFVYCKECGWQQDDFWHEKYNPAQKLLPWNEYLFGEKRNDLDKKFTTCMDFIHENGNISTREIIARNFEKAASHIRKMKWTTEGDFQKDTNKKCPKCGSEKILVD